MNGVAWKNTKYDMDGDVYVLQIDGIKGVREKNKLLKSLDGWQCTGSGYSPKDKTECLLFRRVFDTENEWKSWARKFPFLLVEETEKTGRKKPYKLGLEYQQKTRGRKANVG